MSWGTGTWLDGADWGQSANGKLWQFKAHVQMPHYHRHHISHKTDHDKVPGGDGNHHKSGRFSIRHFRGDMSGDYTSPIMDPTVGSTEFHRDRHHHSFKNAVNDDSSLVHAPVAGMRVNTDASIGGLTPGQWSLSNAKYSAGTGLVLSCDGLLSSPSAQIAIAIGNPGAGGSNNAFYLTINNGACGLFRISGGALSSPGSPTVNDTITVSTSTYYRMRLAVDFAQRKVEAVIEDANAVGGVAYLMLPFSPTWPSFPTTGVNIAFYDSNGGATFSNLQIGGRHLWLTSALPYQLTVQPNFLTSGLDNVPDGASRFAVASVNGNNYPDHVAQKTQFGTGAPGPTIEFGAGNPTNASSYAQGSIYIQTDGGAGSRIWYRTGVPSWVAASSP